MSSRGRGGGVAESGALAAVATFVTISGAIVGATALGACGLGVRGEASGADAGAGAGATTDAGDDVDAGTDPGIPIGAANGGTPGQSDAYLAAVMGDDPLLYYRLEEPAGATEVSSQTLFPAAAVVAAPTLGVAGKLGLAASFDGKTNGYFEVGDDATQFTGKSPFTLEAWVLPHASDNTYRHVFIRDTNDQGNGRNEYGIWLENGKFGFERFTDNNGEKATASKTVAYDTWYHVVGVYDGSSVTLWLNGVQAGQHSDNNTTKTKDKPLRLGTRDPNNGTFNGTIDEIAVYAHALTETQIGAHFKAAIQ